MVEREVKVENENIYNRKGELRDNFKTSEKEFNYLRIENKELRENYSKLKEKYIELNRKIAISNLKLDEGEITILKEKLYENENENILLTEKVKTLEEELNLTNEKLLVLEGILCENLTTEEIFNSVPEKTLYKYFNDMVIKNIDKREEIKKKNKILLEKLVSLGRTYKDLKTNKYSSSKIEVCNVENFNILGRKVIMF